MSGTRAGVSLRVGVQADGVRENLEAIGATGQKALQGVADAARQVEPATASLTKSFERTQQVLDPAARAATVYAQQVQLLARAEEAGLATAQRANELRERAAVVRDRAIARTQAETAAVQAGAQVQAQATIAAQRLGAANDNAAGRFGGMGGAAQAAGQQIQQLWGNISSGQNAIAAVATQASSLLALTGGAGAAVGSVLTYLASKYGEVRSEASKLSETLQNQSRNLAQVDSDARQYRDGLEAEARQVRELTEYYGQLSNARRSQELRQFEADRASLAERQAALRDEALGRTSGLSSQLQQQISDAELMAARNYGRGSSEYEAIVSAPDLARMREIVDVIEQFRASGVVSREELAQLRGVFQLLGESGDALGRQLARQVPVFDGLTGKARDLEGAQRDLAAVGAALGRNMDSTASAAERLRRQMDGLSQYDARVFAGLDQEIANLDRQIAAARVGAGRLAEVNGQIAREGRLDRILEARAAYLRDTGVTGAAAAEAMSSFRAATVAAMDQVGAKSGTLRTLEEGLRGAGQASSELAEMQRVIADIEKDRLALQTRGQSTYEATRTEAERYQATLGDLRNQLAAGAIDQETFNRAVAAADPAVKAAEKAAEAMASRSQQAANAMESNFAGAFTRAFEAGEDAGRSFMESIKRGVKSLAVTIASQLVFRMAVVPVVNAAGGAVGLGANLLGTPNTGLGGLNLGGMFGGGAPVASTAGSTSAALQQGQQSLGLTGMGRMSGLSGAMSYQGLANTGFRAVDGFLNTTLSGQPNLVANVGGNTFNGMPVADSFTASGGATYGNVIGGGLGMAAGAYGVYSGIQRGGVGGAVSAAGGAAGMVGGASAMGLMGSTGWLAALGPYGMIAAAVLSIVGALLPGQKPSGKGQEFRMELGTGEVQRNGLTGNRYSADNANQAEAATRSIANLASSISSKLGNASIAGNIAVGVTGSRGDGPGILYLDIAGRKDQFANTEEGAQEMAERAGEYMLQLFKERGGASGDYGRVLHASGSIEALDENLQWYEGTYKALAGTTEATSAFGEQLKSLNAQWQAAIDRANELSLATDVLNSKRDEEVARLHAARDLQVRGYDIGLDIRSARATGGDDTALMLRATLMQFDFEAEQQLVQARATLEGLGKSSEEVATRIARNEQVLAEERLAIQREYSGQSIAAQRQAAEQAASSALGVVTNLRDYVRGLSTSEASAGTVLDRYSAAGQDFSAIYGAARAGDANSIAGLQGAAETYRGLAREIYGGGQGYADALRLIGDRLGSVTDMGAEAVTQSFARENARENTDRIVDALADLRAENAQLRRDINMLMLRPAA